MKTLKRRIMIIGAATKLGREISISLNDVFGDYLELTIADHDEARGLQIAASIPRAFYQQLNTLDFEQILIAVEPVDCVIVVIQQDEPLIQKACFQKKVTCIDTSVSQSFAQKVYQIDHVKDSLSIIMAGFIPGLSGVIVQSLNKEFDEVHKISVSFLQNVNADIETSDKKALLQLLAKPLEDGRPGFATEKEMPFFHSKYPVKEINLAERKILQKKLNQEHISYWFGWNQPKLTRLISFLVQKKRFLNGSLLTLLWGRKKDRAADDRTYLNVKVNGIKAQEKHSTIIDISAKSAVKMAAFYTAMIADKTFISAKTGLRFPFEVMILDDFNYFDYDHYVKIKRYERELD